MGNRTDKLWSAAIAAVNTGMVRGREEFGGRPRVWASEFVMPIRWSRSRQRWDSGVQTAP